MSSSSSDSEDNVPLVTLKAQASFMDDSSSDEDIPLSKRVETKAVDESSDDEDVPLSRLKATTEAIDESSEEEKVESKGKESSSSDDDVPLSQIQKEVVKKKKSPKKKEKKEKSSKKKRSNTSAETASPSKRLNTTFTQQKCSEYLYESEKGILVQQLLCRWWYAIEWPPKDETYEHPAGSQALDGFDGTYIVVKDENMGSIIDKRSYENKPTFISLFAKPAEELQKLLLLAYENQMKQLIQHEGEDAALLKELRSAVSAVKRVSLDKADSQAKSKLKKWKRHASELARLMQQQPTEDNKDRD